MATRTLAVQTAASLTGISGTLASATYGVTAAYTVNTNKPVDVLLVIAATPGTVSGNKQCKLFIQESVDGTNFRTGPTSGTTVTDEPVLMPLGMALPLPSSTTLQRGVYSVYQALGFMPHSFKVVALNDSGAAFSAFTISTAEVVETIA